MNIALDCLIAKSCRSRQGEGMLSSPDLFGRCLGSGWKAGVSGGGGGSLSV